MYVNIIYRNNFWKLTDDIDRHVDSIIENVVNFDIHVHVLKSSKSHLAICTSFPAIESHIVRFEWEIVRGNCYLLEGNSVSFHTLL